MEILIIAASKNEYSFLILSVFMASSVLLNSTRLNRKNSASALLWDKNEKYILPLFHYRILSVAKVRPLLKTR